MDNFRRRSAAEVKVVQERFIYTEGLSDFTISFTNNGTDALFDNTYSSGPKVKITATLHGYIYTTYSDGTYKRSASKTASYSYTASPKYSAHYISAKYKLGVDHTSFNTNVTIDGKSYSIGTLYLETNYSGNGFNIYNNTEAGTYTSTKFISLDFVNYSFNFSTYKFEVANNTSKAIGAILIKYSADSPTCNVTLSV